MQTINKNLVIVIPPIAEIVFCFMWFSKIKKLTTSVTSTQTRIEQEDLSVKDWGSDLYAWQQSKYALTTNISCNRTIYKQDNSTIWVELDRCAKTFYRCNLKCRDIYKADFKPTRATMNI